MFVAGFVIWFGLDTASYLVGLCALAALAVSIFVYWHIHQHIDDYWQKNEAYRYAVFTVLTLPAVIYLVLDSAL